MSKQDDIQEGLSETIKATWYANDSDCYIIWEKMAINALGYLKKSGCVLKVDRELPEYDGVIKWGSGYGQAQQEMLQAGYCAVEEI